MSSAISPTVSPTAPDANNGAAASSGAGAAAAPAPAASSGSSNSTTSNGTTPAPSTATTAASSSSSAGQDENLVCQWNSCNERFTSPENLYEHLCEKHVGRKSTNNLNLTCQWGSCRTTTVKRDHITSHIRVHVPLKPHKCDFCGKSFKRPQDLKKHVKTHADESVLVNRAPQDQGHMNPAGFRGHPAKAPPSSFYDHNGGHIGRANSGHFGHPHQNGQTSYYGQPQPQPYPHAPQMYYPQPMGSRGDFMGHHQAAHGPSYEARKRGMDDLNEFFGNVKRRAVDPTSYAQVGRSLMPIHASLGIQTGGMATATEYMPQPPHTLGVGSASAASHGPLTQHYYLPPMPNLRTKDDLQQIDHILEQMQATVYENTGSPNSHYAVDVRHQSPTYPQRPAVDPYAVSGPQVVSPLTATSHSTGGTPAVTPPSSAISYTSGHSPTTSTSGMSPSSRHSSTSVSYPSLPSRPGLPYPTSGLGSNFTHNERRLSGGMLQSASAHRPRSNNSDYDRASVTPKAGNSPTSGSPAAGSPSDESSEANESETYEDWLQNMRLIEYLRTAIRNRLERHDYEDENAEDRIDPMLASRGGATGGESGSGRSSPGPGPRDRNVSYPSLPRLP